VEKIKDKSPLFVIDEYNHIQAVKEVACLAIPEDIVATFFVSSCGVSRRLRDSYHNHERS